MAPFGPSNPQKRKFFGWFCAGMVVCSAATAAPKPGKAPASQAAAAEALALQARERFVAKDFVTAAQIFMQAYAKDPQPALVFNAARAYEEAGRKGDAAALFRLYVTISPDAAGVAKAQERLRALEGAAAAASASAPVKAPAASQPAGEGAAIVLPKAGEPQESSVPKWAATGGAVAGLATGVALMLAASADSQAVAATKPRTDAEIATYNADFDSAEAMWRAGAAVTAVGAGLGVWAAWLHLRSGPKQAAWQVDVGPRMAQLTVRF